MKRWLILSLVLLFAFGVWYVPQISAERYTIPIQSALERALGRKVKIGLVQFRLLPLPGFTIHDVEIGEDPAIGYEPMAYVTTLRARPRLSALLGGPLAFASVDLENTSVNMTRADRSPNDVRWNFASLMRPELLGTFPDIHMSGGRVNFKFGDTKSIFYLLKTDIDLWPPSQENGPWTLRVRAEPARTDRPARGFGSFVARGQWLPRSGAVTLDIKLEKSELGDIMTLIQGYGPGLHGHIWGDAHLGGPLSHVGLTGRLTVDDIHGWNQSPPAGLVAWPLSLGGFINLPGQVFETRATSMGKQSPFDLRYRVSDYLGRPRWMLTALFSGMPLAPVLDISRSLGTKIPADLTLQGTAEGRVEYSVPEGVSRLNGQVQISGSTLQATGKPPLRIAETQVRFGDSLIELDPTAITNTSGETATLQGSYEVTSKKLAVELSTDGMSIVSLKRQISIAGAPLLGQAISGTWAGRLQYLDDSGEGSPPWTGAFQIKDADFTFEAFNQPLHVISADALIDDSGIGLKHLNLTAAGIALQGEYRYEPASEHPHLFRLVLTKADGETLEKLLQPTLHRGTFLNYAFNFGRVPEPDWLRLMKADGTIQAADVELGSEHFSKIRTHVVWEGTEVRLSPLLGQIDGAGFAGDGSVDLSQRQPHYEITGKISGLPWRSGKLEADGSLSTSGTGSELLSEMTAKGNFKARRVDLASLETWDTVDGRFVWTSSPRSPMLTLTDLIMSTGGDIYKGAAETRDGQLVLRITDGARRIQAAGALLKGDDLKVIGQ